MLLVTRAISATNTHIPLTVYIKVNLQSDVFMLVPTVKYLSLTVQTYRV